MDKSHCKKQKRYSKEFKEAIVLQVYRGQASAEALRKRYGIGGKMTVYKWLKLYSYDGEQDKLVPLTKQNKPSKQSNEKEMEVKIKELQKSLFNARMQAEAYRVLLELGKEQYGVDLEKKFGAKQSDD